VRPPGVSRQKWEGHGLSRAVRISPTVIGTSETRAPPNLPRYLAFGLWLNALALNGTEPETIKLANQVPRISGPEQSPAKILARSSSRILGHVPAASSGFVITQFGLRGAVAMKRDR
jgi:hypothetical protein